MSYNPEIVSGCIVHELGNIRDQHGDKAGAKLAEDMFAMLKTMRGKVFQGKMAQPEAQEMSYAEGHSLPATLFAVPAMAVLAGSCEHVFNMPEQDEIKNILSDRIVNTQDAMESMRVGMAM